MADKSIISNGKLAAIAQAIKAKDATATLPMTVDEMAAAIAAIPTGGGGGIDAITARMTTDPHTYTNDDIAYVPMYALQGDEGLTSASFAQATDILEHALDGCACMESLSAPNCTTLGDYALMFCLALADIDFLPTLHAIGTSCFVGGGEYETPALSELTLPAITRIWDYAFCDANDPGSTYWRLDKLDLGSSSRSDIISIGEGALCGLFGPLIIRNSRMASKTGTQDLLGNNSRIMGIYVPDSLVATYKADSVWGAASDNIQPLSTYEA